MVGDALIFNVYFPCMSVVADYKESLHCLLSDIRSVIMQSKASKVIIGGDFNFECNTSNIGFKLFAEATGHLDLHFCDIFLDRTSVTDNPVLSNWQW